VNTKQKANVVSSALGSALVTQSRKSTGADREEAKREDSGKRFREYLTLSFIVLTTIGVFAQAGIFYRQYWKWKRHRPA